MTLLSNTFDPTATSNIPQSATPVIHLDVRTEREKRDGAQGELASQKILIIDARWSDSRSHKAVIEIPVIFEEPLEDGFTQPISIDVGYQPEALVTGVNRVTKRVEQVPLTEEMRKSVIAGVLVAAKDHGYVIDEDQFNRSLDPERYVVTNFREDELEVGAHAAKRAEANGGEFLRFRSPLSDLPDISEPTDFADINR